MIDHLVEKAELRRRGFTDPDNCLSLMTRNEKQKALLEEFRVKQIRREQEGGQWVEVRKGIRIFISDGEDKDEKLERFRDKLNASERINKPLRGACKARCYDE